MSQDHEDIPSGKQEEDRIYEVMDDFYSDGSGKVGILLHSYPDPDAMCAGHAFQWLLDQEWGRDSDILFRGEVSHPQNRTAKNILDIRMDRCDHIENSEQYESFISLDCVPSNTGFDVEVSVVIDHHRETSDAPISDIRSTGSTCAIIWDYIDHYGYDLDDAEDVATALRFGIFNDTNELTSDTISELDLDAHTNLVPKSDLDDFRAVRNFPWPQYLFDLRVKAAESRYEENSVMISGLGILDDKRRDALPIIADEFLRIEGIETVIVFAVIGEEIQASVRSRNSSVDVPNLCQRVFGEEFAGGKMGSGGAHVPIGPMYSDEDDEELQGEVWNVIEKIVRRRIMRHV